ncbi:MAG: hypothetical protein IJK52_09820 [Oscillospiraceae bacterium]|nr:hypothetical protein [Oscillospiraceae bacterium]
MAMNDYRSGGSLDRCEVIKVKGEGGAKSIKIPPNSSCLAMDIDDPVVYLVMTDSTGYPSVEAYSIERIPTESEKAASAIEQVTTTLSQVVAQMGEMAEKINKLEASLNG